MEVLANPRASDLVALGCGSLFNISPGEGSSPSSPKLPIGAMVGGTVGGFVVLLLVIALFLFLRRRSRQLAAPAPVPTQYVGVVLRISAK